MRYRLSSVVAGLVMLLHAHCAGAHEAIVVHYTIRPPFTMTGASAQTLEGLAGKRVTDVLQRARIPYRLTITTPLRQLDALKDNKGRDCIFDWYKTIDRSHYARFSEPLALDSPSVYVTHTNKTPQKPITLKSILQNNLRLARIEGYSFGEYLDPYIKSGEIKSVATHGEETDLLVMIRRQHADYAIMLQTEVNYLLQNNEKLQTDIRVYELSDHPKPELTYFLCSQKVDVKTMEAFNKALAEFPFMKY